VLPVKQKKVGQNKDDPISKPQIMITGMEGKSKPHSF
jgi:hypothetical protein